MKQRICMPCAWKEKYTIVLVFNVQNSEFLISICTLKLGSCLTTKFIRYFIALKHIFTEKIK